MEEQVGRDLQWYYNIFAQAQVGIYRSGMDSGKVLDANERMASIAGFDSVEDFCANWRGPSCWVQQDRRKEAVAELRANGHVDCFETEFYRKDGTTFWGRVWAKLMDDRQTLIGVVTDITAEKKAQEDIQLHKAFLESQMEASPDAIAVVSADRQRVITNQNFRRMLGLPDDWQGKYAEVITRALEMVVDGRELVSVTAYAKEHADQEIHEEIVFKDGRIIDATSSPVCIGKDKLLGRVWCFRDVTSSRRAQESLLREKILNDSILDNVPAGIALLDTDFRVVKCNLAYRQLLKKHLGIDGTFAGQSLFDLLPGTRDQIMPLLLDVLATGKARHLDEFHLVASLGPRQVETTWDGSLAPSFDSAGNIDGLLILCRDVTDDRKIQQTQQQTDQWLRLILQHSSDGINLTQYDPTHRTRRLITCNDRYVEMTGRSRQELMDSEDLTLFNGPIWLRESERIHEDILTGQPYFGRSSWKRLDGQENYFEWSSVSFHLDDRIYIVGVDRDVTEQVRAEKAMHESERRYRTLVEACPDAIVVLDTNGRVVMANNMSLQIFGFDSLEQILALNLDAMDLVSEPQRELARQRLGLLMINGNSRNEHFTLRRKDGSTFPSEINGASAEDADGKLTGVILIVRDITVLQEQQQALERSEQRYRKLIEKAADAIFVAEKDTGVIIDCNDKACALMGMAKAEIIGLKQTQLHPPEQVDHYRRLFEDDSQGDDMARDGQVVRKDGTRVWVSISGSSFQFGEKACILCIFHDVTNRRRAQEALRASEERYRTIVETQFECVCRWQPDTRLTYVNEQYCRFFGRTRQQLLGMSWIDLAPEEARPQMVERSSRLAADPKVVITEHEVPAGDGSLHWQQWTDCPIFSDEGKVIEFQSVGRDITESRRAEQELRRERDLAKSLIQTAQTMVLLLDQQSRVVLINPYAQKLMGYTQEEMIGKDWAQTGVPPARRDETRRVIRRAFAGRLQGYHTNNILTKDRREITIRWHNSPLRDSEGNIVGLLGVGSDITEMRQKEEQLRQAQKMEAVGRLAGGIAHDFNNQLTVVKGYCDLLLRNDQASGCHNELEQIRHAAKRAAALTSQLLTFSRQQVLRPENVDLNKILARMANPLATMIGEDIRLAIKAEQHLHNVMVDPVQVEQVIMNLAVNARDAMPHGGQLTLETANVVFDEAYVASHVGAKVGPHAMLSVRDTGIGMDEETMKRIFDPFFTTKPVGQGTGLGLAMVYGFVDQSGGYITVQSAPGQGSSFRIYLPEAHGPSMADTAVFAALVPRGKETIMVVEDSEPVRRLIVRVLTDCGYRVLQADSAGEAIPLVRKNAPNIDLLVTDVVMPEMSGPELVAQLAPSENMKVLYITGYAKETLLPRGFKAQANLMTKPFTADQLAAAVRNVLDG